MCLPVPITFELAITKVKENGSSVNYISEVEFNSDAQ